MDVVSDDDGNRSRVLMARSLFAIDIDDVHLFCRRLLHSLLFVILF